jgi:hypothetical protein
MTPLPPTRPALLCIGMHWDEEEWDIQTWSEDDESLTDGEDLQLLLGGELDEDDEDDVS